MTPQKKATLISSSVALFLTCMKLFIGLVSGSVTVLASALDSILDFFVSVFNFFAIKKSEEPANASFNYGKAKIEALAAVIEGSIITLSGFYILYEAYKKFNNNEVISYVGITLGVMLASLIITALLVVFLQKVAKQTQSMVIKSDALHYKTDLYTNGIILLSLVAVYVTGMESIDAIMGFLLGCYIIYSAFELIKEGVFVLLDASLEEELVSEIEDVLDNCGELSSFHNLKTRHAANKYFVDVHLVFTPHIKLLEAHNVSDKLEASIRALDRQKEWVINTHLDPYDDEAVEAIK